jgi:hypothetical protein
MTWLLSWYGNDIESLTILTILFSEMVGYVTDSSKSGPESYYRIFTPVAELKLLDWRHTQRRVFRVLNMALLRTL